MWAIDGFPRLRLRRLRRCRFRALPVRQPPAIVSQASALAAVSTRPTRKVRRIATRRRQSSNSIRWLALPRPTASSSVHRVKRPTAAGTPRATPRHMPTGSPPRSTATSGAAAKIAPIVLANHRPMYPPFRVVLLRRRTCDPARCHGSRGRTPIRCGN